MRVFVAGGAGAVGRRLVPRLVARGHRVTATATRGKALDVLARWGARGVLMDGLDAVSVGTAVGAARPDAIVHGMTAAGIAFPAEPALGRTDHLLAAAQAVGVRHVVAWSLPPSAGTPPRALRRLAYLEDAVVEAGGAVLRCGTLHGSGRGRVRFDDVASAALLAVEQGAAGVFRVRGDEERPT